MTKIEHSEIVRRFVKPMEDELDRANFAVSLCEQNLDCPEEVTAAWRKAACAFSDAIENLMILTYSQE